MLVIPLKLDLRYASTAREGLSPDIFRWFYNALIVHLHNNGGITLIVDYGVGVITEIVKADNI